MKVFCIFDDFPQKDISLIRSNCMDLDILPKGQTRPFGEDLKQLLLKYDALIIGTGQRLQEDFFYDVSNRKYIVTASTGVDHIKVPENKKDFIKIINAPTAIFSTVAEHIFAFIFAQEKLLFPAREVAFAGKHKNAMEYPPPQDIAGKIIGIIGYGHVGQAVAKFARAFSMEILAYDICSSKYKYETDISFFALDEVLQKADILVLSVPLLEGTKNLISAEKISLIRDSALFVSVSRPESCDNDALFAKASRCPDFKICLDYDADKIHGKWSNENLNIIVTPHIAGGTVQSRVRLFDEATQRFLEEINAK